MLLGAVHLLFLGAGLVLLRRGKATPEGPPARLLTWPPLAVAWALLLKALWFSEVDLRAAGILTLVAAGTFLLSALILRRTWLFAAASLGLAAGAHCLAVAKSSDPTTTLAFVSQVLMVVYWLCAVVLKQREETLARALRQAARLGFVVCAEIGLLWLTLALAWGTGAGACACHLALLAALLFAEELRTPKRQIAVHVHPCAATAVAGWRWWRLKIALALLLVWVPAQAAGFADRGWLTLAAAGWLGMRVSSGR